MIVGYYAAHVNMVLRRRRIRGSRALSWLATLAAGRLSNAEIKKEIDAIDRHPKF